MISRDPQYQRLTRTGRSFYRQASFWLGADHLLSVHIDGYTERYQRFAYRDIQALLIHPTRYFLWVNVVAGLLLLPEVFMFFFGESEVRSLAGVFVVPILIILAVNLFRGPTCAVYLRTAVKTEKLRGLTRRRAARRAMQRLSERIQKAQSAPV